MKNFKNIFHRNTLAKINFKKKIEHTGVTFDEYCHYIYGDMYTKKDVSDSLLYGVEIKRNNTFWFVQNVEEVFVDEVYKFETETTSPVILDCGANIGLSVIYFKRMFPNARITAFEPDSNIYNVCKNNISAFKFTDINLVNAAVWKSNGVLTFQADNSLGGKIIDAGNEANNIRQVKAVRLKDYLKEKIDFLKIDIEGAEDEVLFDCKDSLSLVQNLFIEYHSSSAKPQLLQDLLDVVSKAGFRYHIKSAWNIMEHPFVDHNKIDREAFDMQLNIFAYR
ncbi:FkbM family methyltransferase [Hymenobacter sp. GOD-10R]|uniref:FkbM family methyltransferase n=1 Tax=Hymenobacter sp. GOD-10R TaxID=3093922 RepID=UPI002D777CC4|nr:FkbM family methyltransferase [Hymenobacter sp. GOD-10R]WRQ27462.1 FkbM family methyltransferase [Hymenobacter sp. GOD-10R]